jgi:hypothetical protein
MSMRQHSHNKPIFGLRALYGALVFSSLLGCTKDEPKFDRSKTSTKTETIPSDFALNPLLPDEGKPRAALQMRHDGGLEAGLMTGTNATPQPSESETEAPATADTTSIVEPGQEPRAERKYALTLGKTDARVVVIRASGSQGGPPQEQPPIKFTLAITPQKKTATGFVVEVKVSKVELVASTDAEKAVVGQANQAFAPLNGMSAVFELSALGKAGEPQIAMAEMKDPRAARGAQQVAQQIVPLLGQTLEVLYPPFPKGAIGVGAKWESKNKQNDQGADALVVSTFILKSWVGDAGTISGTVLRTAAKQPVNAPGAPPGTTLSMDGKGTYEWTVRLDKPAVKLTGESSQVMTITAGAKTQTQSIKLKQTIETP